MGVFDSFFGSSNKVHGSAYLPDIFPMPIGSNVFVRTDIVAIYSKILTDVVERTQGIKDEQLPLLWDNCLASESGEGLITLLSKAMEAKTDLYLVFKEGVIRRANNEETQQIRIDYKASGSSKVGVFISFQKYDKTDMIKLYSALEFCAVASLHKGMNLAKAVQYKINDLRSSVSLADSQEAKSQAQAIATALAAGKDVMLDAKDILELLAPDVEATEKSIAFIDAKRCFYLGFPLSYITGEAPKGLGDSGEGDAKAIERGLKNYYFSIIKPVVEAIFGIKTSFKSQDFRQISSALEALKTFALTDEEFISKENKLLIINKLLGVDSPLGEEAPPEPVVIPGQEPPNDKAKTPPKEEPKADK